MKMVEPDEGLMLKLIQYVAFFFSWGSNIKSIKHTKIIILDFIEKSRDQSSEMSGL